MNRTEVRGKIEKIGIVPCARVSVPDQAIYAAQTLYEAGIPVIEITLTLLEAPQVIETLATRFDDLVVGAGTVLDEASAQRSIDAGARFITCPGLIPEVIACAAKAGVVVFPGALTPSEVIAGWKAGADFVKIFPAATVGGPLYIRALKVPLPQIPLIVTGGVNQLTAFDYIRSGATAIGVGRELLPRDSLVHRQTNRIEQLAGRFIKMVNEAREQIEFE
jgi:2-dehydro-3-deoxyphosphogluconate aldolase/(4S)-4-hydroxy-2-oxoglutarate aldolase